MKRTQIVLGLILLIASQIFAEDSVWLNRNSLAGAKEAYETYKAWHKSEPQNYQYAWKFARAAYFYASNFLTDKEMKKKVFTEGKVAAEKAMALKPDGFDGYYQYAVCLGSWAEMISAGEQLKSVGKIINACEKAIKLKPDSALAYMVLARVYHKAPGWPISVGDLNKAKTYYQKSFKLDSKIRTAYRFYAELLIKMGNKKDAKQIIEKGLALPLDSTDSVVEKREIKELQNLKNKVK